MYRVTCVTCWTQWVAISSSLLPLSLSLSLCLLFFSDLNFHRGVSTVCVPSQACAKFGGALVVVELCVYDVSLSSCLSSDIQSHVGAFFATM